MCIFYTNLAQIYFLWSYIQPCLLEGHQVLLKKANKGLLTLVYIESTGSLTSGTLGSRHQSWVLTLQSISNNQSQTGRNT